MSDQEFCEMAADLSPERQKNLLEILRMFNADLRADRMLDEALGPAYEPMDPAVGPSWEEYERRISAV